MAFANFFYHKQRCPKCWKNASVSREEKEIFQYVKSVYNGEIIENDRTQIFNPITGNNLELDIWIPELNKAIEYNGEYWHSKKHIKYRDDQKLIQCKEKGIGLLVIEDNKWKQNKDYGIIDNFIGVK
jgi:hypothetical protein